MGIDDTPCDTQELEKSSIRFAGIEDCTLYCSPLQRAIVSAEYMFPHSSMIIDQRLIEKNLGDWSGLSKEDLRKTTPEAFLVSGHLNPLFIPPNGESFEELKDRSFFFLKDIIAMQKEVIQDKRIFVMTHNGVIRTMRCIIEGLEPFDFFKSSEVFLNPIDFTFELSEWNRIVK